MERVQKTADTAAAAAKKMGVRVRMTEGNTCYRGGKPGVSDVFAAALWAADYSLLLASNQYSGIHLHGGTGKSVADSVPASYRELNLKAFERGFEYGTTALAANPARAGLQELTYASE